tara:strand:+ start:2843 stop:3982 length:1140 start_codon:yes stop_codon:yes gene_type:complete
VPGFELIDKKEKIAVNKLFSEGGILFAHGFDNLRKNYHIREFEKQNQTFFKSKYCLAVSSGTAAIKVALMSMGVKKGDHVITQAFNFIATVEAILDCGAIPIIVNVDKTLNMDVNELKKKITKKTKVVIPVHMLGASANIEEIIKICKKKNIRVLEDNCEAVGGKLKNKYLGTVAEVGVFSFDFGKMITTGEGGLLLTDNPKVYKYAREYHDHGHENNPKLPRGKDTRSIFGFNYRMTEMQAVVGKEQLKKLNYLLKENYKRYHILDKNLNKNFEIRPILKNSKPNYDTFIFYCSNILVRKKILEILKKNHVGTKNLPDAIKWHCTFFWDHALSKKTCNYSKYTKELLNTAIAIPILVKKKISLYEKISKEISFLQNKK